MFCQFCGKELKFGDKVCSNCGAQVEDVIVENNPAEPNEPINRVEPKFQEINSNVETGPFKIFAGVGLGLGIASFVISAIPFAGLCCICIPAMVFSVLGIKSKTNRGKAITGLVFSCVALIITLVYLLGMILAIIGATESSNVIFD